MLIAAVVLFAAIVIVVRIATTAEKIAEFKAGPQIVLHHPAQGPSPVALTTVSDQTQILDRRLAALVQKRNQGEPLDEREQAQLAALGEGELRVGDTLLEGWKGKPVQRLPLAVKVKSEIYAKLVASLQARGVADPHVVAEALLAAASKDQIPTLCTTDLALRAQLSGEGAPYREESGTIGVVTFSERPLRLRHIA
jgi:hypothetical protein